jgi:hypothetical protein
VDRQVLRIFSAVLSVTVLELDKQSVPVGYSVDEFQSRMETNIIVLPPEPEITLL